MTNKLALVTKKHKKKLKPKPTTSNSCSYECQCIQLGTTAVHNKTAHSTPYQLCYLATSLHMLTTRVDSLAANDD